jgi:hypothetical protein
VLAVVDGHSEPVEIITTDNLIHALVPQARADSASTNRREEHVRAGRAR